MFRLQGQPALHAGPIVKNLLQHGRRTSWWHYKVNSYRFSRGPYSSVGYLLMTRKSLRNIGVVDPSEQNPEIKPCTLQVTVPNSQSGKYGIEIHNVVVVKATAVNPGRNATDETAYVVELGDMRRHLEQTTLRENFNVVSSHSSTKLDYYKHTIQSGSNPYSWESLFNYIWSKSDAYIGNLIQDSSLYPSAKPCNIMVDGYTVAEALDYLLSHLGLILYYDIFDGNYYIRGLDQDYAPFYELVDNPQNSYMRRLREIKHQETAETNDLPGKLIFSFPSRKYLAESDTVSAEGTYRKYDAYEIEKTIDNSPYPYVSVNPELSLVIPVNPVAYYSPNGGTEPINKSELESYVDTVSRRYQRKMASNYGPVITFEGLLPDTDGILLFPGRSIAAVTWFINVTSSGRTNIPKTTVEVPEASAIRNSNRRVMTDDVNTPYHRSIIVKPRASINNNKSGVAEILDYRWDGSTATEQIIGLTPVLNISGSSLKTNKYTSDFHWPTQQWAVWPGATPSEAPTGGSEVIRFKLAQDLVRGQGIAEAFIIDNANNPIDENGDIVPDVTEATFWQAGEVVNTGDIRKAPLPDPIDGRWDAGDIIEAIDSDDRTTGNIFNSQEAQYWEKYTDRAKIAVVDIESKRYGYTAYEDEVFGDQPSYTGTAVKIPGDDGQDVGGTGYQGYYILDMEAKARWVEGYPIYGSSGIEEENIPRWKPGEVVQVGTQRTCPPTTPGVPGTFSEGDVMRSLKNRVTDNTWDTVDPIDNSIGDFAPGNWEPGEKDPPRRFFVLGVKNYWGASPNNRCPKLIGVEGQSSEEDIQYGVKVYARYGEIIDTDRKGNDRPLLQALLDDATDSYILASNHFVTSVAGIGMLIADVPPAQSFNASSSEVRPGMALNAIILLQAEAGHDPNNQEAVLISYKPVKTISVDDSDVLVPKLYHALNFSRTGLRGDFATPVCIPGNLVTIGLKDSAGNSISLNEYFECHPWDYSATPNHQKGNYEPNGMGLVMDDPGLQIVYHNGGSDAYRVASRVCTPYQPVEEE